MEREPTRDDVDALVGPATPHFAYQLRARVASSSPGFPSDHDVRRYARGEDRAARPARLRLVEGRGRAARADDAPRLGADPERRPGRRARCRDERVNVLVTGGSRGIGRAIALRFARDGASRVAIGYLRNDAAAEATADELRAPAPSRCSSAATSPRTRVLDEVAALGPLDVLVHNAATGVVRAGARDRGQALGLDAERERARAARARARRRAADAGGSSIVAHLLARLAARARELRARRDVEGGARGARPLPRGRARAARDPRQRRVGRRRRDGRARALPQPGGDARARRARTRPAGSSSPRTSPARSRSSARRTPR